MHSDLNRTLLSGDGTRLTFNASITAGDGPTSDASWAFAVYTWDVPSPPRAAPAPPQLPATMTPPQYLVQPQPTRLRLLKTVSGQWPQQRHVDVPVPPGGSVIAMACTSVLADREMDLPDEPIRCADAADLSSGFPSNSSRPVPTRTSTYTWKVDLTFDPIYLGRTASWSIGVYGK